MKKISLLGLSLVVVFGLSNCEEETFTLGDGPREVDAAFTFEPSSENANIINFTANNPELNAKWDFGNGTKGDGPNATAIYPNKGTYTVSLTVLNSGGSASSTQEITIAEDDLSLLNSPLFTMLTGGIDGPGFKTWVMDSTKKGHFGVGPNPSSGQGDVPEYFSADPLIKKGVGMYDDKFVFKLGGFKFDQITNGNVYVNLNDDGSPGAEADFSGGYENQGDFTASFEDQIGEQWTIKENEEDTTLTVSGNSFIGFYCGTRTYKILKLTENELSLRVVDAYNPLAWYFRFVPSE